MSGIRIHGPSLFGEIQAALERQEPYDVFEARMLERMGIGPLEEDPGTPEMQRMDHELEIQARAAWDEGLRAACAASSPQPATPPDQLLRLIGARLRRP